MSSSIIADRLKAVQDRMKEALALSSRREDGARLVIVTKYQPIEILQDLYGLGVREMGESRVAEALEKMDSLPSDINWHLIGTVQQNKVPKIAGRFSCIHSVDTLDLARKLSAKGQSLGVRIPVLLQVNPLHEVTKHGFSCEELEDVAGEMVSLPSLSIQGLMAMAPRIELGEKAVHQTFSALQEMFYALQNSVLKGHQEFTELSMGMSQDFEIAIRHGATIVRIGSLLF